MYEQSLLELTWREDFFGTSNTLTNSTFGVNKTAFHLEGCSCAGCHLHDGDGKDFQPGGAGTASDDSIPASTATTASLTPGSSQTSSVDTTGDHDWFAIDLTAGETYTFTIYLPPGGLRDSTLDLRDSSGNVIASNDDVRTGLLYSEIIFTATSTGTFYLDVGGYGTATGQYYVSSSRPTDDAVGGDVASSTAFSLGSTVNSVLDQNGDRDWFAVTLEAGEVYEFRTNNTGGGGDADTTLTLRDASGNVLAWNDDSSGTYSRVRVEVETSGTYYIDVGGWADSSSGAYQLEGFVAPPLQEFSNDQIADQLLSGYWGGAGNERRFDVSEGDIITVDITGLTADGQFLAREALGLWSDVLGVSFNEVSSGAQITFDDEEEGAFASSSFSNGFIISSDVNISTDWLANSGTTLDSYSFQTYLHEIGHALGLGHGGNYNSTADYTQDALYLNDSWATTVMSYFSQSENDFFSDQGFSRVFTLTPMMADIVAIQSAYGGSTNTRTEDNTYGVGNNTGRAVFGVGANTTNTFGNLLALTIYDNGGNDTLNYSSFSAAQLINLNAETFSNVGGSTGNLSIARGTIIENAVGGSGNDQLIGNDAANVLTGGAGNDTITGGDGMDTAVFSGLEASYTVTETSEGVYQVVGADGTDTVSGVEFLRFDDGEVELMAPGVDEDIVGTDGRDVLTGGLGDDTIDGGSNVDIAVVSGLRSAYTVTQTSTGVFRVVGPDGTDTLTAIEYLRFDDETIRLLPGTGVSVNFNAANASSYQSAMNAIRDFDGNALGGNGSWLYIGQVDVNGDGDLDRILVNDAIGRFATVGTAPDGLVYFDDHSWAGETRVAGIYIDPLVASGEVVAGSDFDSQRRFQNDLRIENITNVLGAEDYDNDGVQEVYFALADGTAYLRALMHDDGNIRYANYQSEQQVIDYLTANGYDESTYGDWFSGGSSSQASPADSGKPDGDDNPVADPETGDKNAEGNAASSGGSPSGGTSGGAGIVLAGEMILAQQSFFDQYQQQVEFFG